MRRGTGAGCDAIVKQQGIDVERRRRKGDEASGAKAVIHIGVPLVTEQVGDQRIDLTRLDIGDVGVGPEAEVGKIVRYLNGVEPIGIDGKHGAGNVVLWQASAPLRVAPGCGRIARIGVSISPGFLVGNHRLVGRATAVDARFPTKLPIHLIAAEECEVDAGIARSLDVRALLRRPIFIVAD